MKLLCKSLVGILLLISLPFGSFSPTHREEDDGNLNEMESQVQLALDQDFLAPQEHENDARLISYNVPENDQTSSDSTAADKTTSDGDRELSSENHPKMEKREPFDFGGSSRSGKRASFPREKQSQIVKREPFDFGRHSRTGKRTSGHENVVSQEEADEKMKKAELLQQDSVQLEETINSLLKRYKEKTVNVDSRTALSNLKDVAMELKREDNDSESLVDDDTESLDDDDTESLDDSESLDDDDIEPLDDSHSLDDDNEEIDGRNSFDDQVDETTEDLQDSRQTKPGNKVPVPGFLGSIKGFDSRLEPLGNPMEPEED